MTQDIHFSQNNLTPLTLNPANTGNYNGSWRVGNVYRRQWASISSPYITNALMYDQQLMERTSKISGGVIIDYDKSGDLNFTDAEIYLSGGYHIPITNRKNTLSFGFQPGISMKSISQNNLTFPDQFDQSQGSFNPALASDDVLNNLQKTGFLLNAGLAWTRKTNKLESSVGIAVFNLTQTNTSFFNAKNQSSMRVSPNASAKINIKSQFFIAPMVQYQYQSQASSVVTGCNFGYSFGPNEAHFKHLYIGSFVRTGFNRSTDAVIPNIGARIHNFDVGFAYDVNISSLQNATRNRGAIELAIIYTQFFELLSKITPTCERM